MPLHRKTVLDYLTITSGVLGRLAISFVYFLIVANVLSLADFGVFASASAAGLVISRLLAFGFISPVYRAATVKPRLLGVYAAGLALFGLLSLPLVFLAAGVAHGLVFEGRLGFGWFLLVIAAEVLCWRVVEYVVIALNGLSRFARAAALVIAGSAVRTAAAILFLASPSRGIEAWILFYLAANAATLALAFAVFAPRVRLRFAWRLYPRRLRDAVSAAVSEITFYAQAELDKLLVLGLAGERTAGLYAIAMRLIDLTAIPVRSFNQMFVQRLMKDGEPLEGGGRKALVEGAIAAVSTLGLAAFILLLWIEPAALGRNVAEVSPYLVALLAIPALRNLIEYQAELLYARELVVTRAAMLAALAALKLGLMWLLLSATESFGLFALPLTGVYAALYAVSAAVSYGALARSRK